MTPTGLRTYRSGRLWIARQIKLRGEFWSGETAAEEMLMERSEEIARAWLDTRKVKLSRRKRYFAPWAIPGARAATKDERRRWQEGLGTQMTCDHEEQFVTPDGLPAIIVGHNYDPTEASIAQMRALAEFYGLRLTVAACESWYYPGRTTLVEYSAP